MKECVQKLLPSSAALGDIHAVNLAQMLYLVIRSCETVLASAAAPSKVTVNSILLREMLGPNVTFQVRSTLELGFGAAISMHTGVNGVASVTS